MKSKDVYLTTNINEEYEVGLRYDNKPVILKINSLFVWSDRIDFYNLKNIAKYSSMSEYIKDYKLSCT